MIPLAVTARIEGPVSAGDGVHLDALLAYWVCRERRVPAAQAPEDLVELELPLARSECDRYWLASCAVPDYEHMERRFTIRRFPLKEAMRMGDSKLKRVATSAGVQKTWRVPMDAGHVLDDSLSWYAVGDPGEVERLLRFVTRLGKRRAVGLGRVISWEVEEVEPWDGFPVVSPDGEALRHLPHDDERLTDPVVKLGRLEPPYWMRHDEVPVAMPAGL